MKKETEVHVPEILPEKDLESTINQALVKANITDVVINGLKEKYGTLRLKSVDDKESYLEVKEARKEVRKIGILTETLCKKGRENALREQKMWLAKEKEVLGKIDEVQEPLDAGIKEFEDNQARIEAEERQRQEEQFMQRQTVLLKMEAKFEGGSFTLGNISYEINNIKEADEEIWNDVILNKFKKEFEKVEAVRAEEEKKKQEAADELKRQQEELLKQRAEFEEQQRLMAEQQKKLDDQKREQEEAIRFEQQRKDNEAREAKAARDRNRIQQLQSLGLHFSVQNNAYVYEDVNIDVMTELNLLDDNEWNALIEKVTPIVSERKAASQKREQERIEKEKQEAIESAIKKEKERHEEEKNLEAIRLQQEQEKQAEEAAKASDKDKWAAFVLLLNAIALPEFKSTIYKGKLQQFKEKMEEVNEL